jgi:microcystin-dependent protein
MTVHSIVPGQNLPSASIIDAAYPIGIIYESDDPTEPAIVFGRGTWERMKGVILVGVDEGDTDFNAAGKTGGEKNHVLTAAEMPSHSHTVSVVIPPHSHGPGSLIAASAGNHLHNVPAYMGGGGAAGSELITREIGGTISTDYAGAHIHQLTGNTASASPAPSVTVSLAGEGKAHNNMPPYRTTFMWRRTG